MTLWTVQPEKVLYILDRDGVFTCDESLCDCLEYFHDAYNWMVEQMDRRGIKHPEDIKLPLWAWHTRDWKHKKPNLKELGAGEKGEKFVCIEFEIPEEDVLLSDFNNWHYVLNNVWFDNSSNEEEWEKLHSWYDSLPSNEKDKLKFDSWQKVFDVAPYENDWASNGRYIQGTFWELKKDMVRRTYYEKNIDRK